MSLQRNLAWTASALVAAFVAAAPAVAQLTIGFESPPYVTGSLQSQEGWTGGPNFPRVQTGAEIAAELVDAGLNSGATVHSGSQSLLVTYTPGEMSGGLVSKPFTTLAGEPHVVMDWWARPLTPGVAGSTIGSELGNTFVGVADSSNRRAAAVRFGVVRDDTNAVIGTTIDYGSASAGSAVWVPSGLTWAADTWYNFRFELNYGAKAYDFYVNDSKVNDAPIQFYSTSSDTASSLFISRGQNNAGQILDDFSIAGDPGQKLQLTIDPASGDATVKNNSNWAITLDSYTLASASNSLRTSWASLADQAMAGWQEAVPTAGRVSELNPTGDIMLAPGQSFALNGLWNTSGVQDAGDLEFKYRDTLLGTIEGVVSFGSSSGGDFDNDGDVDGADFLVWQRGGSPSPLSAGDLAAWKSGFGTSGTPAEAAVVAVPEPASMLLVALGLGLIAVRKESVLR